MKILRDNWLVGALIFALMGFVLGQFVAGVSASRSVAPLRALQDAGASVANRLSRARGLEPNSAHPERREQFGLFPRRVDVVMVGDSITAAGMWEDMFPGTRIANRGLGSDRTDDVFRRVDAVLATRPRSAFIMLGINDLAAGRDLEEILKDYVRIIEALRGQGIRVVIQSTLECNVDLRRRCRSMLPTIRQLNARLAEHAGRLGIEYIDLNAALSEPASGLRAVYTIDGVHLTGRGYALWASLIDPLIGAP
jgi:lysophospholipase L1-like esterase